MNNNRFSQPRYATGAVALDFVSAHSDKIMASARRLIAEENLHIFHVVRLDPCHTNNGFEPSCMEQEYRRCEAQLKTAGEVFGIALERQSLIIGSIQEQIANFVRRCEIELLILGSTRNPTVEYPIDVISGCVFSTQCDLLMVRTD